MKVRAFIYHIGLLLKCNHCKIIYMEYMLTVDGDYLECAFIRYEEGDEDYNPKKPYKAVINIHSSSSKDTELLSLSGKNFKDLAISILDILSNKLQNIRYFKTFLQSLDFIEVNNSTKEKGFYDSGTDIKPGFRLVINEGRKPNTYNGYIANDDLLDDNYTLSSFLIITKEYEETFPKLKVNLRKDFHLLEADLLNISEIIESYL